MHRPINDYTTHKQHIHTPNTQHKHINTYINFLSFSSYCCNKFHIHIHIYTHTYKHIYIHIHMHTYTHIYIKKK